MRHFIAVIHKDEGTAYGVHFPDVPRCFSAGDTLDEAIRNAGEALRLFAEDSPVPDAPRDLDAIRADPALAEDIREGCTFAAIPFFLDANRNVRANISMDAALLEAIDETARARGQTRSGFLTAAARAALEA